MTEVRRPLSLAAAALFAFVIWLGWGVAHPAVTIVTVYEPYIEFPVLFEPAPPVVAPQQPPEQSEQRSTTTAAVTTTTAATTPYHDVESLQELLGRTPWPVGQWENVIDLVACESEGYALALGDEDLLPFDGPSKGLIQTNVKAHPHLARTFDLFDPLQNLVASYIIWVEAGHSFSPWKICSEAIGLR